MCHECVISLGRQRREEAAEKQEEERGGQGGSCSAGERGWGEGGMNA